MTNDSSVGWQSIKPTKNATSGEQMWIILSNYAKFVNKILYLLHKSTPKMPYLTKPVNNFPHEICEIVQFSSIVTCWLVAWKEARMATVSKPRLKVGKMMSGCFGKERATTCSRHEKASLKRLRQQHNTVLVHSSSSRLSHSWLVDRPTQLICISDIYLSTDKYKRHSRAIC